MRLFPAVLLLAALALSGCGTAGAPDPNAPVGSGTPTESPSETPSDTSEPTAAPTCDTILNELGLQDLADDGLTPLEYMSDGGTDLQFMIDAGGVVCRWGKPASDITATVGQAPISQADWDVKRASLEAQGFTLTDDPATGFLLSPPDAALGISGGFLWRDGQLYYVSNPTLLNSIPALQE